MFDQVREQVRVSAVSVGTLPCLLDEEITELSLDGDAFPRVVDAAVGREDAIRLFGVELRAVDREALAFETGQEFAARLVIAHCRRPEQTADVARLLETNRVDSEQMRVQGQLVVLQGLNLFILEIRVHLSVLRVFQEFQVNRLVENGDFFENSVVGDVENGFETKTSAPKRQVASFLVDLKDLLENVGSGFDVVAVSSREEDGINTGQFVV